MSEYLYAVYGRGPTLERAEVIKRTAKLVFIKDSGGLAFGCRTQVPASEAEQMYSPRVAWETYRDRQAQLVAHHTELTQGAARRCGQAIKALESL